MAAWSWDQSNQTSQGFILSQSALWGDKRTQGIHSIASLHNFSQQTGSFLAPVLIGSLSLLSRVCGAFILTFAKC